VGSFFSRDDLRRRVPELRKREQAISAELNAIDSQLADRAGYLRLAETVTNFLARLRETAKTLDVAERQRIVRLLVKEILVDDDTIVIRHSIPAPTESTDGSGPTSRPKGRQPPSDASYLLRKGSHHRALSRPLVTSAHDSVFQDARLQPFLDQADNTRVADPMLDKANQPTASSIQLTFLLLIPTSSNSSTDTVARDRMAQPTHTSTVSARRGRRYLTRVISLSSLSTGSARKG